MFTVVGNVTSRFHQTLNEALCISLIKGMNSAIYSLPSVKVTALTCRINKNNNAYRLSGPS